MMFDWLNETERATRLESAIARVIAEGKVRTYDMGGRIRRLMWQRQLRTTPVDFPKHKLRTYDMSGRRGDRIIGLALGMKERTIAFANASVADRLDRIHSLALGSHLYDLENPAIRWRLSPHSSNFLLCLLFKSTSENG